MSLTTTTTMTSTSVTSTRTGGDPPPGELIEGARRKESEMVTGSEGSLVSKDESFTVIAVRLSSSNNSGQTVAVEGTDMEVGIPASVFADIGVDDVIMVVTSFDTESAASMGSEDGAVDVKASVRVNFHKSDGELIIVEDLTEPIQITLSKGPVGSVGDVLCAYWYEFESVWVTDGLEISIEDLAAGSVVCNTRHFTLFAAITRNNACTRLKLLSAEGLAGLRGDGWHFSAAGWFFWGLLLAFELLLTLAALLDIHRCCQPDLWADEDFLVALGGEPEDHKGNCSCRCVLLDVVAEICSSWRRSLVNLCDFVRGVLLKCKIMAHLLDTSARMRASTSLGMSHASSKFMLEVEKADALAANNANEEREGYSHGIARMRDLQEKLASEIEWHLMNHARWAALPGSVCRLFLWQNPIGWGLVRCLFLASTLRVVLFMVEVVGALMLCAVYFQVTESLSRRVPLSGSNCEQTVEPLGQLVAVGFLAFIISVLPAIVLRSLSTRRIATVAYRGCEGWKRLLWTWRVQDVLIWLLALAYLGLSGFFILLFLANVSEADQEEWIKSGVVAILLNLLIVPLCVSLIIPLFARMRLSIASSVSGVGKVDLIRERHVGRDVAQKVSMVGYV